MAYPNPACRSALIQAPLPPGNTAFGTTAVAAAVEVGVVGGTVVVVVGGAAVVVVVVVIGMVVGGADTRSMITEGLGVGAVDRPRKNPTHPDRERHDTGPCEEVHLIPH